ncbi:MAG: adenine phosphoribosyltransferase [Candidatus Omnitrophica bacterium CG11_big_fil_rev_8_21_14_0_20_64_10]|nr:MAG: adenine phosphoribosyltransferase [Candidatus Omnitrophica bacterium CG11_big_fil_rev_8_21_14_0_20_64_10]
MALADLRKLVRDVPGYPKPGIVFKDLTPLWADAAAFKEMTERLVEPFRKAGVQTVAAVESRGLILGSAMAYLLEAGLAPVRKAGKLPWNTVKASYKLEYGSATAELHADAFPEGTRVLLVDDLLATGGTAAASLELIQTLKGKVVGAAFLVELTFLKGAQRLKPFGVTPFSLLQYDAE